MPRNDDLSKSRAWIQMTSLAGLAPGTPFAEALEVFLSHREAYHRASSVGEAMQAGRPSAPSTRPAASRMLVDPGRQLIALAEHYAADHGLADFKAGLEMAKERHPELVEQVVDHWQAPSAPTSFS